MKKTMMALAALAGVASATTSLTLDSSFTPVSGTAQSIIDAGIGHGNTNWGVDVKGDQLTYTIANAPTVNVTVSSLLGADAVADDQPLTLTAFVMLSRPGDSWYVGDHRTVTVTVGDQSWTSNVSTISRTSGYGTIIYTFADENAPLFLTTDTLKVVFNAASNEDISFGCVQPLNGATLSTGTDLNYSGWAMPIRLEAKTPEPATATLSLLALAALASRRKRH